MKTIQIVLLLLLLLCCAHSFANYTQYFDHSFIEEEEEDVRQDTDFIDSSEPTLKTSDSLFKDLSVLAKKFKENGHDELAAILYTICGIVALSPAYTKIPAFEILSSICYDLVLTLLGQKTNDHL